MRHEVVQLHLLDTLRRSVRAPRRSLSRAKTRGSGHPVENPPITLSIQAVKYVRRHTIRFAGWQNNLVSITNGRFDGFQSSALYNKSPTRSTKAGAETPATLP